MPPPPDLHAGSGRGQLTGAGSLSGDGADWAARIAALAPGDEAAFDALAHEAYRVQVAHNPVYAAFVASEGAPAWAGWRRAPVLPAEAFRLAPVAAFDAADAEAVFVSSGTGQGVPARHAVRSLALYETAFAAGFVRAFGEGPRRLLAHLPGYADRGRASSLVYMAEGLVARFGAPGSGLFLDDPAPLDRAIADGAPLVLLGAAFGLMDLCDRERRRLPAGSVVVETGGMKTHRREIARAALHAALAEGFGVPASSVGSEYGMCELLSQAWARGGPVFAAPPWLGVRVVDPLDPARELPEGEPGQLALCDLANLWSCSFLLTEDRAVRRGTGFEVLGRLPKAALRGCNFLVETARPSAPAR